MKNIFLWTIAIVTLLFSSCGGNKQNNESAKNEKVNISVEKESYKPGEKEALIVLKAYADKDLETLKTYAGGAQKMVLDETDFKDNSNVIGFREKISNWDGAFKEIRYYEDEINFQEFVYAVAAFYESPSGQITAVELRSTDKNEWKMAGFGTKYIKKAEFEELSTELPE